MIKSVLMSIQRAKSLKLDRSKNVFSSRQKTLSEGAVPTDAGKLFYIRGAAELNLHVFLLRELTVCEN